MKGKGKGKGKGKVALVCGIKACVDSAAIPTLIFYFCTDLNCRSQWPPGLRRMSAATRLLILWVQVPARTWKFVCCEYRVFSSRCLCDELITCPEESCRLWCVVVCDLKTSWIRRPWPTWGCRTKNKEMDLKWVVKLRRHALVRRLCGPHCWSGSCGEDKNDLTSTGIES